MPPRFYASSPRTKFARISVTLAFFTSMVHLHDRPAFRSSAAFPCVAAAFQMCGMLIAVSMHAVIPVIPVIPIISERDNR
jgi:hypothetical protein